MVLITGCAGFIGFHLSNLFLERGHTVIGIDNINDYYDVDLKKSRLEILKKNDLFIFNKVDISDESALRKIFLKYNFKKIIHLAAQAGVRYSIEYPKEYFISNLLGFYNILSLSVEFKIEKIYFSSTSSVYGDNKKFPYLETHKTDHPLTFYAATKKSNEIMAYSFSQIYNVKFTSFRFFTVYGPYGRPDMAIFSFVKKIINNEKVQLYNYGKNFRDFTHVSDLTMSIYKVFCKDNKIRNNKKFDIFNIGNKKPISNLKVFNIIKKNLFDFDPKVELLPPQIGDVIKTHASTAKLEKYINFSPKIDIENGIFEFIEWYKSYYKISN